MIKFNDLFKYYTDTQDNLCQVEKTINKEKRILFIKKTIPHTTFLGMQIVKFDLDHKQICVSELLSPENPKKSESRLLEILDLISLGTYDWNILLKYDEYDFDTQNGIVTFVENTNMATLAIFDLSMLDLQVFTEQGYISYEFDEIDEQKIKSQKKNNPAKKSIKRHSTERQQSLQKITMKTLPMSEEQMEQVIQEMLNDDETIKTIASVDNEGFKALINATQKKGFSSRDSNMLVRKMIRRARIISKSLQNE